MEMLVNSGSFKCCEQPLAMGEVLDNTNFVDTSVWGLGSGWSISGGKATHTGTAGSLSQIHLVVGREYLATFEVTDYVSGIIGIAGTTISGGYYATANGVYSIRFTAVGVGFAIYATGDASLNYVTCVEVQEIPAGAKFVQCISDGYFSFEQPHAYGSWTFEWYLHDRGYLSFISDREKDATLNSGYSMYFHASGTWYLRRYTAGGASTVISGSGLPINTWKTVKITRTLSNEFKIYFDGVLGGTGTNADHTTSMFAVMDMDAGDCIRNFVHRTGVTSE